MMWVTTIIVDVFKEFGEVSKGLCKKLTCWLVFIRCMDQSIRPASDCSCCSLRMGPRELQDTVGSVVKKSHAWKCKLLKISLSVLCQNKISISKLFFCSLTYNFSSQSCKKSSLCFNSHSSFPTAKATWFFAFSKKKSMFYLTLMTQPFKAQHHKMNTHNHKTITATKQSWRQSLKVFTIHKGNI